MTQVAPRRPGDSLETRDYPVAPPRPFVVPPSTFISVTTAYAAPLVPSLVVTGPIYGGFTTTTGWTNAYYLRSALSWLNQLSSEDRRELAIELWTFHDVDSWFEVFEAWEARAQARGRLRVLQGSAVGPTADDATDEELAEEMELAAAFQSVQMDVLRDLST